MPQLVGDSFSGPPPKFDFERLGVADGKVWLFAKGSDYDSSEQNFRMHLVKWANKHGYKAETRTVKERGRVRGVEVRLTRKPSKGAT